MEERIEKRGQNVIFLNFYIKDERERILNGDDAVPRILELIPRGEGWRGRLRCLIDNSGELKRFVT